MIRSAKMSGDEKISPGSFIVAKISPVTTFKTNTFPFTVQQQQISSLTCDKLMVPTKGQEPIGESSLIFQLMHISIVTL